MKKILVIGDAAETGFGRVTGSVIPGLIEAGFEVVQLGINYRGDPHDWPWRVYPARLDHTQSPMGLHRTEEMLKKEKPDLVWLVNDAHIVQHFLPQFPPELPVTAYMPPDSINQFAAAKLNGLAMAFPCTQFGAHELKAGGYHGPFTVIPHGVDTDTFRPTNRVEARKALGFPRELHNAYIVGNINRNQMRKRLDLTIIAFAEWLASTGADAMLLLHCALNDKHGTGWDIPQLASYYGLQERLILTGSHSSFHASPVDRLVNVYNALDVQMTTTLGEGWGLTTMEGMACGVPQIAPEYSALGEWPAGAVTYVPATEPFVHIRGANTIGYAPRVDDLVKALDTLYDSAALRRSEGAAARIHVSDRRFNWSVIAAQYAAAFKEILNV